MNDEQTPYWDDMDGKRYYIDGNDRLTRTIVDKEYWLKLWRFMNCRRQYDSGGCVGRTRCAGCMYDMLISEYMEIYRGLKKNGRRE